MTNGERKPLPVVVKFFPPIADSFRNMERQIVIDGSKSILEFIDILQDTPEFNVYFERIADYRTADKFLHDVIVIVNDHVAENEACSVAEGDVVKFIMPLAGG